MVYFDGKNRLRDMALKSIDETIFYPAQGQASPLYDKLDPAGAFQTESLGVFFVEETGQPLRDQVIDRIADIYEKEGI